MFGSGRAARDGAAVDTLIGRHTEVLGDIRFSGGLHVDGCIKGCVTGTGEKAASLSVSEGGSIQGNVKVATITLNGTVTGDVYASERLTLAAKAKVFGNVYYQLLQMEPGATIDGKLVHQETARDSTSASAPSREGQRCADAASFGDDSTGAVELKAGES
ncbi:MAG TPA: polymer-forming cytoskeletal protein [Nevskiaceae bacterium]|nr:polymer-forming cytoskeletal protein [Nevskiaceae bacterium]